MAKDSLGFVACTYVKSFIMDEMFIVKTISL